MTVASNERRLALLEVEASYGVDPTPTGADALIVHNGEFQQEADDLALERDSLYLGNDPSVLTGKRGTFRGEAEVVGHATPGTAAPFGKLIRALGHAQTLDPGVDAIYNPISDGFESATIYFYHADILYKASGAMGAVDSLSFNIKDFPKLGFNLLGLYAVPVEAGALPTPVWTDYQEPPVAEAETLTVTVNGVAVEATQVSMAANAVVRITEHSEGRRVLIVDRKPEITLRIHKPSFASLNPFTIANARTRVPIAVELNGGAGKIINFDAPSCQLSYPRSVEEDGFRMLEIRARALPVDGDDEYTLAFA
jgi:hypothetical protein